MKHLFTILLLTASHGLYGQPALFSSKGVGGGGALFAPSINPANNNEYYVACDMSGLYHTTDLGLSYSQVHFNQFIAGHNSKVCYTATPNLLYSISYFNDIGKPVKSTDNGLTWSILTGNPDASEEVYSIYVDYNNASKIIISTYGAIYFSNNGGANFTEFHTAENSSSGNVVGGVFFDGNTIYVGTNDGVLVSVNSGATWNTASLTGIPTGEAIWSFTAARVGSTTRLFCLTGNAADIYVGMTNSDYYGFFKGIYSCEYGSTNWTSKNTGITANDYPMLIDMAQNDINTVYIAGSNSLSEPIIMKTTNAGASWTHQFITANNQNIITGWSGQGGDRGWSYGECPLGFDVATNNAQVVIFSDLGFCHKTTSGGSTWQQAYVAAADQHPANAATPAKQNYTSIGLENTTSWQVHWADATTLWSCFSDIRGVRSTDNGNSWSFNYAGNTANTTYRVAQGSNGTLYAATSNIHDMYQSTRLQDAILDATDANGKLIYSTDKGQTWLNLHTFNHPVFWITLDPTNNNRAYASVIHYGAGTGSGGVYRCDNLSNLSSSTWTLLPNPPRTEKHPAALVVLNDGKLVATYSGRRVSNGTFTASSGVFIYDPISNSWTDVSAAGMHYWTKDVVIDPNDITQNTWYACVFSGWGGAPNGLGGLYKTTNRGTSWTKLTGTTLDRVTSCTFNPVNPNEIYITTEAQGLWKGTSVNSATPAFSVVSSYPFKQPERVFFNPYNTNEMWVTSFGNGMKVGLMSTSSNNTASKATQLITAYPNPFNEVIYFSNAATTSIINVYNAQGKLLISKKGKTDFIATESLLPGLYIVELILDNTSTLKKKMIK